jgi:hypothetical protein
MPNLTDEERKVSQVTDDFSEWFSLAKEQGIVLSKQVKVQKTELL